MTVRNSSNKQIVLNKLIKSGINITPTALNFVLKLDDPLKKVDLIVKQTNTFPTFNNHITEEILNKISNKEIQKIVKRVPFKEKIEKREETLEIQKISTKNKKIFEEEKEIKELEITGEMENTCDFMDVDRSKINNSKVMFNAKHAPDFGVNKGKKKGKIFESTKSSLHFKPLAKEYDSNYKIIRDPTGKIHTTGSYDDFYEMTLDKFNKLRTLMKKRNEVLSANNINKIMRLSRSTDVSTIGMVNEIRQTKKGNYFIELEDLTGNINVIVRNDSKNQENVRIVQSTIRDQMVFVEGTYNPGEKNRKGIIFVNFISKINMPTDFQPNKSLDPLSIAFISDTHIGSKEFEISLWDRFVAFLNGKNTQLREIAGRIKYIIINGDLVDGIGIYPSQQRDLLISDIFHQYEKASELLSQIPEYIKIIYSSGNHEPVRNAIPRPAVPKKYCKELIDLGVTCIGNPSIIQTHDVNSLVFHGDSLLDMSKLIPHLENDKPVEIMKELLICRHLAPIFGEKTQIAPINKDFLIIDKIPDIFHTGHTHINGIGQYRNVSLVNSGCFQAQTDFMKSLGINPTPGIVPIIELDTLKNYEIDLKKNI